MLIHLSAHALGLALKWTHDFCIRNLIYIESKMSIHIPCQVINLVNTLISNLCSTSFVKVITNSVVFGQIEIRLMSRRVRCHIQFLHFCQNIDVTN